DHVVVDSRPVGPGLQRIRDTIGIEAEVGRVLDEIVILERELPLEQPVVHLPEGTFRRGGLRRFRRMLRVGMQLGEREVTEHKPQTLAEPPLQLFDHRPGFTARCTLKVAVFDERHRRRCRAGDVVSFSYWWCESAALRPVNILHLPGHSLSRIEASWLSERPEPFGRRAGPRRRRLRRAARSAPTPGPPPA